MRAGFNALSLVDVNQVIKRLSGLTQRKNPKLETLNQVIKPKPYTPNQVIKRLSGLTQRAVVSIGVAGATGA